MCHTKCNLIGFKSSLFSWRNTVKPQEHIVLLGTIHIFINSYDGVEIFLYLKTRFTIWIVSEGQQSNQVFIPLGYTALDTKIYFEIIFIIINIFNYTLNKCYQYWKYLKKNNDLLTRIDLRLTTHEIDLRLTTHEIDLRLTTDEIDLRLTTDEIDLRLTTHETGAYITV